MQYFLILLIGFIQLNTCNAPSRNKSVTSIDQTKWTVLLKGQQCAIDNPKNIVIKSQAEHDKLWNEMQLNTDQPAKPTVDFSSKWIIACFLGNVSSAGHSVEIKSVHNENNKTIIQLTHIKPGPDCMTAQVIESPFILVSIDQFDPHDTEFKISNLESKCE